jgi:acetoin utilization deacetylase AcuC-like enzyme
MADVGLVFSGRYLQHNTNPYRLPLSGRPLPFVEPVDHPSNPRLVERTLKLLDMTDISRHLLRVSPYAAPADALLAYHSEEYIQRVQEICEAGGGDTGQGAPAGPDSYIIALLAAGGAMVAVDTIMAGEVSRAYALVRPPGHHAMSDRGMGFCIFNNVVVAARHAQRTHGLKKVMILDWDVHHGNGTQNAFYDDPTVLFFSIHQDELYPEGWGAIDQVGTGNGIGTTVNVPLPPGSGDATYLTVLDEVVLPIARSYRPDLVMISAGQDASASDPLGRMSVTAEGYRQMTNRLILLAEEVCGGRLVAVQEGGYSEIYAPYCTFAIVEALTEHRVGLEEPVNPERAARWPQSRAIGRDARAAIDAVKEQHRRIWPID